MYFVFVQILMSSTFYGVKVVKIIESRVLCIAKVIKDFKQCWWVRNPNLLTSWASFLSSNTSLPFQSPPTTFYKQLFCLFYFFFKTKVLECNI